MRTYLPVVIAVLFSLNVNGQATNFKHPDKKPEGSVNQNLSFEKIDGRNALKSMASGVPGSFKSVSFTLPDHKPIIVRKGGVPVFIERKVTPLKSASAVTTEARLFRFLEENTALTGIKDPQETFSIKNIHTDDIGITHIRTVQHYKGIEIYGTESVFHFDSEKERFTGSLVSYASEIDINPKVQYPQALELVKNDLSKITAYRELTSKEKSFLKYDAPECTLMLYAQPGGEYTLAWMVWIRPNFIEEWHYTINASDGSIIRKFNNTKSDGPTTGSAPDLNNISRTFDVYLEAGTYYLMNISMPMFNSTTQEGMIMTLNANNTSTSDLDYSLITSTNNTWSGMTSAVSAHYNAFITYEYFRTKFNRNSINDQGGNIISFINVAEDDGSSMENAFWNGQAVFYGNGGPHFKSLSGALDVSAHELGHGVVSNTANLEYQGQSGAINESYADIFGSMVDRDDWQIGEDVVKPAYYPSGALRDMSDPHNGGTKGNSYWQPAHLSEMYLGSQDNGGVHINSGIVNKAFYLFATAVTKEKAEKVFYRALTEYLTKTSQFIDLRIAVVQAAKDLYAGANSTESVRAGEAFDAVGIYPDKPETDVPENYDPNPGQQYLLIYNTDEDYTPTLYTSPASGNIYLPLSSSIMKGKVSVTDDGSAAVFVDTQDRINVMTLDPEDLFEEPISEQLFDNVAVSKDGTRLAAVSVEADASIYVYDFGSELWKTFNLYNPTTGEDIKTGGVLFADAIEFDHTGEYIIYDAYNELNSSTSDDISYWDVGFIKVWDNQTGNFGDGTILKLFTQLPENVSVGNPVFSKNSPNIIAFDYYYYDGFTEEFGIYGANLETGDLNLITENTTIGYPSFSKNDDKLAYTVSSGLDQEDVYTIQLGADKISASGSPSLIMEYAKWPVYYAKGERNIGLAPVANFTVDYKTGNAPLIVKYVDLSENSPTAWSWTFQGGTPSTSTLQNPQITYNNPGTYRVNLKVTNSYGDNTISREGYIVISGLTPVEETQSPALMFFPNPADDLLQIQYSGNFTVRILSQSGTLLKTVSNEPQIDISTLSSGAYILEIETESEITRHKLLKQ